MAQHQPPVPQFEFFGVHTEGNPSSRPRNTAAVCRDLRVMPGRWLRLRGGRVARYNLAGVGGGGVVLDIKPFRTPSSYGSVNQLAHVVYGGTTPRWNWFSLLSYLFAPSGIEDIATAHDGGFCLSSPAAACNLNDRPLYYQGRGVRDSGAGESKPPFSTYGGIVRYFGLDSYCPAGNPTVGFVAGPGHNEVVTSTGVQIWVGLYNSATAHYGNAVMAGTIAATGASGTITVSDLNRLKYGTHGAAETAELFYVFYATNDGGKVPYLILDSTLSGPLKCSVAASSQSLSVTAPGGSVDAANGWVLNRTKEAPRNNFPPRPMRQICFVNGRLYGVPMNGGAGSAVVQPVSPGDRSLPDFSYIPTDRELAGVVWSKATSDADAADSLGDPLQCWPLTNGEPTPTFEQPLAIFPEGEDKTAESLLVITASSTFRLVNVQGNLHRYVPLSRTIGIRKAQTVKLTPYGIVWVSQRNEIVLLPKGGDVVESLSVNYQSLLVSPGRTADYLHNPIDEIDRYEVVLEDGTSVIHDFRAGAAYTATRQDWTAMASVADEQGRVHHIAAKTAVYTRETQPENGLIPAVDQTFTGTDQTTANQELPDGLYMRNWDDFGDLNLRKEIPYLDALCDGEISTALNARPVALEWYANFEEVTGANKKTADIDATPQTRDQTTLKNTMNMWRFFLRAGHRFAYKLGFTIKSHTSDSASFVNFQRVSTQGDLPSNFYGSILRLLFQGGNAENRS